MKEIWDVEENSQNCQVMFPRLLWEIEYRPMDEGFDTFVCCMVAENVSEG